MWIRSDIDVRKAIPENGILTDQSHLIQNIDFKDNCYLYLLQIITSKILFLNNN